MLKKLTSLHLVGLAWLCCLLAITIAATAGAAPLTASNTWGAANPGPYGRGTPALLTAKGTTDNEVYVLEVNPVTGAIPVTASAGASVGHVFADSVRNVYSVTNVTTGAWVQLIASTAATINQLHIFDSCGQTLELGTGAAAAETRKFIIAPGGPSAVVDLLISAGTRLSVRAISANCIIGELDITGLN